MAPLAPRPFHLSAQSAAFQIGEVIDEQLSPQVVHLVLDTNGEQPLGFEFIRLPVLVKCFHVYPLCTVHFVEIAGYRKAAFLVFAASLVREKLGIDQHPTLVFFLRHIDDRELKRKAYLGCGQADAGGGVHGLEHVFDRARKRRIEDLYRRADFAQAGIRKMQNSQYCHRD